jgi:dolichyl-phosphate-mannose--protein O-mannosyl transferase
VLEPPVPIADPIARNRVALVIAIILLISLGVRMYQLTTPPSYMFDEVYYAKDANVIAHNQVGPMPPLRWTAGKEVSWPHPEMGKQLIAVGILLFGDRAFGWRMPAVLAGMFILACIYPLARRLGLSPAWSLIALGFAAADTLGIAQSRIATLDIFIALWTVVCILMALRYIQEGRRLRWLLLCGLAGGFATATKWSGVLALLAAGLLIAYAWWRDRPRAAKDPVEIGEADESAGVPGVLGGESAPRSSARATALSALKVVAALVALPAAVYLASYGQYFAAGHTWADFVELHRQAFYFSTHLKAGHTYASIAPTWIVDYRPVWYYFKGTPQIYRGVDGIPNPFLWWFAALSLILAPILALMKRTTLLLPAAFLVAVLYFPWFATQRTSFLYYMTPVAPFMAILVASALCTFAGSAPRLPRHGILTIAIFGVGTAVLWEPIGSLCAWVFWELPRSVSTAFGWVSLTVGLLIAVAAVGLVFVQQTRRYRPLVAMALVGMILGISVAFLPIVLNIPMSPGHFNHITWFRSWI